MKVNNDNNFIWGFVYSSGSYYRTNGGVRATCRRLCCMCVFCMICLACVCVSLSLHPTCFPSFPSSSSLFLHGEVADGCVRSKKSASVRVSSALQSTDNWIIIPLSLTLVPLHLPLSLSILIPFSSSEHPLLPFFTVYHISLVHIKLSLSAFTIHCVKKILSSLLLTEPHSDQQQKHMSQEHLQKSCTNIHQAAVFQGSDQSII